MRKIQYSLLLIRHLAADLLTGPLALALLPITLMAWNATGATIGTLIALMAILTLATLAALTDRHLRQKHAETERGGTKTAAASFDEVLRASLYRARQKRGAVLCMIISLTPHTHLGAKYGLTSTETRSRHNGDLIRSCLRRRDQVSRLGPDRYGVVINAGKDVSDTEALTAARRLKLDIERASTYDNDVLDVVIGASLSTGAKTPSAACMMKAASAAMQTARTRDAADVVLRPVGENDKSGRRSGLSKDIIPALEGDGFQGWFQPQICAQTGRVTGYETLARWIHPTEGVILPARFLPILQQQAMMPVLLERMLNEALNGFEAWRNVSAYPPSVGINLSPEDLCDPTLPDRIQWELDKRKIAPGFLNIEVLETVIAKNEADVTARNVQRLSDIGCRIDLDDFGTGHTSISSLKQFALHRLKIDRSFVEGVDTSADQEQMISAILTMARHLDLETLAEGVETPGEAECLRRLGCSQLQGFGIARPMPLEDALDWLIAKEAQTDPIEVTRSQAV